MSIRQQCPSSITSCVQNCLQCIILRSRYDYIMSIGYESDTHDVRTLCTQMWMEFPHFDSMIRWVGRVHCSITLSYVFPSCCCIVKSGGTICSNHVACLTFFSVGWRHFYSDIVFHRLYTNKSHSFSCWCVIVQLQFVFSAEKVCFSVYFPSFFNISWIFSNILWNFSIFGGFFQDLVEFFKILWK